MGHGRPLDLCAIAPEGRSVAEVRANLAELEGWGVRGVLVSDHLFLTPGSTRHREPLTLLAAIGALSDSLSIGTYVANVWLRHPAQLLREFAQLACLYGGERVVAGVGAGWHALEFGALGLPMPAHESRLRRLEQTLRAARAAFAGEAVTLDGDGFSTAELRLSPMPERPPTLLVGGGSRATCRIGARYADVVDLNAPPKPTELDGTTVVGDLQKRLLTRVADLEELVRAIDSEAAAAPGRSAPPRFSTFIHAVVPCDASAVEEAEARLCAEAGLPPRPLGDCPFVLVGDAGRIRAQLEERIERLRLDMVVVGGDLDAVRSVAAAL